MYRFDDKGLVMQLAGLANLVPPIIVGLLEFDPDISTSTRVASISGLRFGNASCVSVPNCTPSARIATHGKNH